MSVCNVCMCVYACVHVFMHVPLNSAELCMVEKQIGSNEVAAVALPLPQSLPGREFALKQPN